MENISVDSLPLIKVLPLFLLALFVYGIVVFSVMHFRQHKALQQAGLESDARP